MWPMPSVPRPRLLVPAFSGRVVGAPIRPTRGPKSTQRQPSSTARSTRDGCRQSGTTDWRAAIDEVERTGNGFVWIGLHEPTEAQLAGIAERFGLHPLAVEDAVHAHQRPKLDAYDDMLFAVVKTVHYDDRLPGGTAEVVETGEVMVFLGANFVITVRHGEHGGLREVRQPPRGRRRNCSRSARPSVLHAVLDAVVDSYTAVCRALQEDIDEVESRVFSSTSKIADSNVIYVLKREVLELRRSTAPLLPVVRHLTRTHMPQVAPEIRDYFRDVDDHLTEVVDQVSGFDDLLTTLVSANLAQVSVVQNEDMRKISAWVAIAAVPTMLAGIYGMNFRHMPELDWEFGYPLVLALMATVCGLLFRAFKKNGWL